MQLPPHFGRFALIALAVTAILYIFNSPPGDGGAVLPIGRRLPFPDFTMADLHGQKWNLSSHRGKVVLVNVWASWCGPCRSEIPGLVRLAKSRTGLEVAGIALHDEEAEIRSFVAQAGMPYPVLLPPDSWPMAQSIQGLPTTFLIDRQGRMARQYLGAVSERLIQDDVDRLLLGPSE
jgi:cytochrome c biogenesis protein CcmG, thiol:disulfide interchange protein DsbE